MRICMIGCGYVGLVSGTCFAESGNDVICVDIDPDKVSMLNEGRVPIYEPGLGEMVARNAKQGRLTFTLDLKDSVEKSHVIFIAVGTPAREDGSSDTSQVLGAARAIADVMDGPKIVVTKSTVPVGTTQLIADEIASRTPHLCEVVSNPEFLKEGAAVDDFLYPDRVVIGTESPGAAVVMKELYAPFTRTGASILLMDTKSSEITKYAANAMLASRISFMNEMAGLCERLGADIEQVRQGIATDTRIGRSFLFAGVGYGGSCFPKDVKALAEMGRRRDYPLHLVEAIETVNENQKMLLVRKIDRFYATHSPSRLRAVRETESRSSIEGLLLPEERDLVQGRAPKETTPASNLKGQTFAVWGLSFKPRTDDMREAPSQNIVKALLERGARVQAHDPEAMDEARKLLGDSIAYSPNNYDALEGADALLLLTEWGLFRNPDFERMKKLLKYPVIFDGRNQFNPDEMKKHGFIYFAIGRG